MDLIDELRDHQQEESLKDTCMNALEFLRMIGERTEHE